MTAMRLVMLSESARLFMEGSLRKDEEKIHDIIYHFLARKRRPLIEDNGIVRLEENRFKMAMVKFSIFFYLDEKDTLHIVEIKKNPCN